MHAPSRPGAVNADPEPGAGGGTVVTSFEKLVPTQSGMTARARSGPGTGDTGPSLLRVVPLLRVSGPHGMRVILVGHSRLAVQGQSRVAVESFVNDVWVEGPDEGAFNHLGPAEAAKHGRALEARDRFEDSLPAWPEETAGDDGQLRIAGHAKALAELSRNSVADVREIRYGLEHQLARFSSKAHPTSSNTPIVASLLELNIICGRAADQAREAIREGLWLHLSDSPAYHAYRRLQDPSIISEAAAATASTRPWMRLHDAAVRQCLEMRKQLDAESNSARNLMAAAASVSSSREADAQAAFTTLAAVASFGLGIPALVLALYGADRILPLDSGPRQMAFLPVAAGFLLAAVIAVWRAPKGKSSWRWVSAAVGVILFLLTLLVAAGLLAPPG